jgi:hypothetical protein
MVEYTAALICKHIEFCISFININHHLAALLNVIQHVSAARTAAAPDVKLPQLRRACRSYSRAGSPGAPDGSSSAGP